MCGSSSSEGETDGGSDAEGRTRSDLRMLAARRAIEASRHLKKLKQVNHGISSSCHQFITPSISRSHHHFRQRGTSRALPFRGSCGRRGGGCGVGWWW